MANREFIIGRNVVNDYPAKQFDTINTSLKIASYAREIMKFTSVIRGFKIITNGK